ncbi:unnamed protein product [Cochlearia groenlandica]
MSGNQEPRISLPTWRCVDFNAAIPIKKRKFFVQPQVPVTGQAGTNVGRSALDISEKHKQNMIGSSVSAGNAVDQVRVKVEEPNFPVSSSTLAGFEMPSSSSIFGDSLHYSLGKLPVGNEHPGAVFSADETGMKVEHTVLKTHDIVREASDKENLRRECQTETSAGVSTVSIPLGFKTKTNSPYWENVEPTSLDLSLNKGVCAPRNTDSVCTKSGNHVGVNRTNWDLNTTMDAWEDSLDRNTRVNTIGSFLNSNRSLHDIETSSYCDRTVISKSDSEKQNESKGFKSPTLTSAQFSLPCSLSLGLSSYPAVEKSPSLLAIASEARYACTSLSRPIVSVGKVNPVNLRTVKSEIIEESVRQETESALCPVQLSINRMKPEIPGRSSQENTLSSGIRKSVAPISVKAEPNNFTQSEVFNRRDGTLNHPHRPIIQSNEILDLPTSSTPNQKDRYLPYSSGISNAPMSLNGMEINPGSQSYTDYRIKVHSGQNSSAANGKLCEVLKPGGVRMTSSFSGHGDHSLNASGVKVTSLAEEKTPDDCKTCISKELPRNSRGNDDLSISEEKNIKLSGKELQGELYSHGLKSDCGHDVSRVIKKQVGKINLYGDRKVNEPPTSFAEGNEVAFARCSGSRTEQNEIAVPFNLDFQNTNRVEKGNQPELLHNTGENEGNLVHACEQSTHQTIYASEGMSGVSTLMGGNIENPEIADNSSPVSYKAEISTIDNDSPAVFSEGSQRRIINLAQVSNKSPIRTLDASDSFASLRMQRDRLPDFPLESRRYPLRGSGESFKFSHGRYHGEMRSPRSNFMPDRRRFSDKTENNLHDRDSKNFEFDNHGNTRQGGAITSNFYRGRRPANDVVTPFSNSFPRRTHSFSYTHRDPTNKEDSATFHGFRDGEKFSRGFQSNKTEPMFMSPPHTYQGRNGFARGRAKYSNSPKRDFADFRSRSPIRSRERSPGPSSSFRNRSQEDFSGHTDFSRRRSPSNYRMGRTSSPEHSGYSREMVGRRHNSPPYSHRPSNAGRGRGYARGRGYVRGRGYGRDGGNSFRKPFDRFVHRNHGNFNNLDPRERVDYNDDFFEGPNHSERFGGDVNVERGQYGYRHVDSVDNDPDAVRFGQDPDNEMQEQESSMGTDGNNKNALGRSKNTEDEESSKDCKVWQQNEHDGEGF